MVPICGSSLCSLSGFTTNPNCLETSYTSASKEPHGTRSRTSLRRSGTNSSYPSVGFCGSSLHRPSKNKKLMPLCELRAHGLLTACLCSNLQRQSGRCNLSDEIPHAWGLGRGGWIDRIWPHPFKTTPNQKGASRTPFFPPPVGQSPVSCSAAGSRASPSWANLRCARAPLPSHSSAASAASWAMSLRSWSSAREKKNKHKNIYVKKKTGYKVKGRKSGRVARYSSASPKKGGLESGGLG